MTTISNTESKAVAHPGLALATVALATILLPISLAGASVALPSIGEHLHAGLTSVQWVVNGYDLTFAAFMLATGSLADLLGRRRMFVIGMATFALASLVCAMSADILMLDLARAVAGIGAAAVLTSGSASLAHIFEGAARAKAFGIFGTAVGAGLAFGPFVCGVLTSNLGWRSVFLVPAIVGAIIIAASCLVMPESRNPEAKKVDWGGTATFTGALFALIFGLLEGSQYGWGSPLVIGCFLLALVLFATFTWVEQHHSEPLFDLSLLKQRRFASLCLAIVALVFAFTPLLVYLPLYYIGVDGISSQRVGLNLMMLTLPTLVMPIVTGYLSKWLSVRALVLTTMFFTGLGVALLTAIHPGAGNWVVLPGFLAVGIGIGISFGVMDGAAVSTVDATRAGMAAGMFNTMRLGGEAIGIAVVGTMLATLTTSRLGNKLAGFDATNAHHPKTAANLINQGDMKGAVGTVNPASAHDSVQRILSDALTSGLHITLWSLFGLCLLAGAILLVLDRSDPAETITEELVEDEAVAARV